MAQHHTESSLLSRYLLTPSSLPTIFPYASFLALHKSSSNPATASALKKLYQDLHYQRKIDIDTVRLNIDRECARGGILKAKLRRKLTTEFGDRSGRKRKRNDDEDGDVSDVGVKIEDGEYDALNDPRERAMDEEFFGANGAVLPKTDRRYHTTASLLEVMQTSIDDLEREIRNLDEESERVLGEMQETVGGLSDLRYGKFARVSGGEQGEESAVEAEVVDALRELTHVANQKAKQASKGKANG